MDLKMKKVSIYYVTALLFSWICWIVSMAYASANDIPLLFNEGVYIVLTDRTTVPHKYGCF